MNSEALPTSANLEISEFKSIPSSSGTLVVLESGRNISFEVRRLFYIFDTPAGETRGRHAHRECKQLIVCVSGKCEVTIDDGKTRRSFLLSDPRQALYVPPYIWAEQKYLSPGTIILVLADQFYDENDYFRNYEAFLEARNALS